MTQSKQSFFQDAMDQSRLVAPQEQQGNRVLCKVYWRGKGNQLNYGGTTSIAAHLLSDTATNKRIGFYQP